MKLICSTCRTPKPIEAFPVRKERGRSKQCRVCVRRVQDAYNKRRRVKTVLKDQEQWVGYGEWNGSGVELLHYEKHQTLSPVTLAEWASVCKGFRVVIRDLLDELGRKDYTVKLCKRCGKIREHSPKGRRCRDCWRQFDKQREIDYKKGFTRPRTPGVRGANGRYTRTYVRKELSDA